VDAGAWLILSPATFCWSAVARLAIWFMTLQIFDRLVGGASCCPSLINWNDRGHADVASPHILKIKQLRSVYRRHP
jgi:hypothetical protein